MPQTGRLFEERFQVLANCELILAKTNLTHFYLFLLSSKAIRFGYSL